MLSKPDILSGFSLIELLVTITLGGIVLSIAIPSFSETIVSNRLTAYNNDFISALNLARSEAVKRGYHVVVRKTGANWENGWQVFVDIDRSTSAKENVLDTGKDIELKVYPALPTNFTLRGNNNFVNFIRYQPDGTSNNTGSFALCAGGAVAGAKLIIVNAVGRARSAASGSNVVPITAGGSALTSCTSGF